MPCELRDRLFLRYNDLVLEHAACSLRLADVAEIGNHTYFRIERRRTQRIFDNVRVARAQVAKHECGTPDKDCSA
jgi:hypothetical protein